MSGPRERTRAAILEASAVVLGRNHDATLPAVAEAAGVGRTTLHRYFPDRESLLSATTADSLAAVEQAVTDAAIEDGSPVDAMRRLVAAMVSVGDRLIYLFGDPRVLGVDDDDCPDEDAQPEPSADQRVIQMIKRGQAEGAFDDQLTPDWIQQTLWALVYTGCEAVRNGELTRHAVVPMVTRTLEGGIRPA
ncbi:TetR/AcrR family transcriptional regulator [Pseudonocardia sp. TRM90224]|uniref:TetR/AcrR family transcriptional regulator n=1 Tax=Pseudonocardia sp. TRM90224 TaxID=2812678 RepID=UPI001E5EA7E9|nr:TetR/AcrR family transcriptional regulator [Pseudonocardia sp. TRM90224]